MNRLMEGFRLGGRYSLTTRIASGGMGDVWEATDDVLARTVAVKVMRATTDEEPVFAQRFRDEALYTANLSHPNVATVYDYGEEDSLAYLVMELVPGEPLSALVQRRGALPAHEVRSIMGQAALALGAAHEAGVVHRDVKPGNIMVTPGGEVKLTDFGIARAVDGSGQTRTGEVLGTPHYLSPEQALGEPATGASDLYALGVVAHEMLTGRRPFEKNTPVATALSQVNDPPPPLPDDVPSELRALIEQCLAKAPAARPESARELGERLGLPEAGCLDDRAAEDVLGYAAEDAGDVERDVDADVARESLAARSSDPQVRADGALADPTPTPTHSGPRHARPRRRRVHWAWVPASGVALVLALTSFGLVR
ncbi:serine/threonine-protein kinase [Phycicoccus avicenniae]|nr:serine/threonine-protein kinase [Phycicoccus avicenniae]